MSLTKRQVKILMILKNQATWVTSEQLSKTLDTNKKTIQNDINSIVENLGPKIELVSNRRTGYLLNQLDEEYSKALATSISDNDINSSMNLRASIISTYLCFQTDFVSMQSLADTFYLSKTSISESVKIIQRRIDRNRDMKVLISNQYGVKVQGTENEILMFLSLITNQKIIYDAHLAPKIYAEFIDYQDYISHALIESLKEHDFTISGDVFYSFIRFIALIILRSQLGFQLESIETNNIQSPIIASLMKKLDENPKVQLSDNQIKMINERFLEFAPLVTNQGINSKYAQNVQGFEKNIISFLNLPVNNLFERNSPIYSHIERMMDRIKWGHSLMNHYAHQSITSYPLEMYLVRKFIPINFGINLSLAETGYIVDYLAEALEAFKNNIRICLVSDKPFASIRNLKKELNINLNNKISKFDIFPRYLFDNTKINRSNYDVFLTTEESFIFLDEAFLYVDDSKSSAGYDYSMANLKHHVWQIELSTVNKY